MSRITLLDCNHVRLEETIKLSSFNCNDDDLNDFLLNESLKYYKDLLAVTNLFFYGDDIVSFYSVSNDGISYEGFPSENSKRKFWRLIPCGKRHLKVLPAVKIGRLGVNEKYQGMGIGSQILDLIKMSFTTMNKTGCRFITVDAYKKKRTINFYKKNGFIFFPPQKDIKIDKDKKEDGTISMYFDLMKFVNAKKEIAQSLNKY